MKHINFETQPSTVKSRKGGLESTFQILLLLIGLGGVWYIRGGGQPPSSEANPVPITVSAKATKDTGENTLDIQGPLETGARLRFVVKGDLENDQFLLDSGQGNRVAFQGPRTIVTYDEAGIYQVKLWKKMEGSWRLLHSEHLQIEDHLGVVSR